ncbi:SDR family NAD(P)-dependent oxidoreductase [Paenibacillus marinisediminis]
MDKVVVLGATGTIGKVIVKDLVESGVDVIAADLDQARLDEMAAWVGRKITTTTLNIRDFEAAKEVLSQCKVCVNATNYVFNLDAMKVAAAAGASLLDLGGLFKYTNEQLKLDAQMKEANILSIVGMGSDPGTSNVFCRYGVNLLDSTEEIHIRYGSTSSGATFAFAADTIIDEAVKNAVAVKNGELVEIAPLSDEELTPFHNELGIQKTYSILHSELATLPTSFPEVKEITYKDTWDPATIEKIRMLEGFGLTDTNALEDGTVPRRQLVSLLTKVLSKKEKAVWGTDSLWVEIIGRKNGNNAAVRMELLTRYHQEWGVSPTQYATAIPASIAAQMLLKGEISEKGVKPPELCIDPETYFSYLKHKDVDLYITFSETKKL